MKCTKVGVVSLGCDKNRVDTEYMLGVLTAAGFEFCSDPAIADIIVVNTCAFISAARTEAIDTVLEMAEYKKGGCKCLVVTGCLPQKYLDESAKGIPEVDIWLGTGQYQQIADKIKQFLIHKNYESGTAFELKAGCGTVSRQLTTPRHYAYLRVSDGCSNHCTFCTIPSIRGKYKSEPQDTLIAQACELSARGVKELILIAQDTTRYGADLGQGETLVSLIRELSKIKDIELIRLMYCYPEEITDELIQLIADNPKVAKYIDMPLQHADDRILRLMNRRSTYESLVSLIRRLRAACPDISIRSTFMVGFPGETEESFETLLKFLEETRLNNVGFFAYSDEDTPSKKLPGKVLAAVKKRRLKIAAGLQQKIVLQQNSAKIGSTVRVVYEDIDYERGCFVGRTQHNAPEIDCKVFFTAEFADIGQYYNIEITGVDGYDLTGRMV